ncbi:MAG: hypothetical protein ACK4I8_02585, partial [Armatimonadota bacterium]
LKMLLPPFVATKVHDKVRQERIGRAGARPSSVFPNHQFADSPICRFADLPTCRFADLLNPAPRPASPVPFYEPRSSSRPCAVLSQAALIIQHGRICHNLLGYFLSDFAQGEVRSNEPVFTAVGAN